MKAQLFSVTGLSGLTNSKSGSRKALWIPDAQLLIQWMPSDEAKQITRCEKFPPSQRADIRLLRDCTVPVKVVHEAQDCLEYQERYEGQKKSLEKAHQRIQAGEDWIQARLRHQLRLVGIEESA